MSAAAAVTPGDNIYDNGTQRGCSSSCSIPKPRKCSFCAKAYHERDRCPARDALCYSCKKEVISHGPVDPDLGLSAVVSSRPSRHR